jgi:excisionase family DNA binding protein
MPRFTRKHKIKIYLENPPRKGNSLRRVVVEDCFSREAEFLTTSEACVFLGMSERHFRRLLSRDQIPHKKIGSRHRYRVSELHKWVKTNNWRKGVGTHVNPPSRRSSDQSELWLK